MIEKGDIALTSGFRRRTSRNINICYAIILQYYMTCRTNREFDNFHVISMKTGDCAQKGWSEL